MSVDARLYAPSVERNRDIIAAALANLLPTNGVVLEIASGTGEHAVFLAAFHPALIFQPSDPDAQARASIDAWARCSGLANIRTALAIDAAAAAWPIDNADAILCINMVHISPWEATLGLFEGATRLLPDGGRLVLYGAFLRDGVAVAPGNAAFDLDLRARNSAWGLRRLEALTALATGFGPPEILEVAANNLVVVYVRVRRRGPVARRRRGRRPPP